MRDPGFGKKYLKKTQRMINADGSFNVKRIGGRFSPKDLYVFLIEMNWFKFLFLTTLSYFSINAFFGLFYSFLGEDALQGVKGRNWFDTYLHAFYFSSQTFTTVGYGTVAPKSNLANIIAAAQAFTGLLWFAVITGLLYGRFSSPKPKILFSKNALIAPYENEMALEFRVVNERNNTMIEMDVEVILSFGESINGVFTRSYHRLELEIQHIFFFPLPWTIVHPINAQSPLYGKSFEQIKYLDTEVLILLKGYDKSYKDTVHTIHSYKAEEFIWNARFVKNFYPQDDGKIVIDLSRVNDYERL